MRSPLTLPPALVQAHPVRRAFMRAATILHAPHRVGRTRVASRRARLAPFTPGRTWSHRAWLAGVVMVLAGCVGGPPPPDWQANAKGSIDRAVVAYLNGDARIEAAEFARARAEAARTGQPEQVARIELMRCAAQVASLVFDDCPGFLPLREQAAPASRAYADYLAGGAADTGLLPPAQQTGAGASPSDALKTIDDPLSRLVAIGVRMRTNRIDPAAITLAIDTASDQGWRRPLLAWLTVQLRRAEAAGAHDETQRLRMRIGLVEAL